MVKGNCHKPFIVVLLSKVAYMFSGCQLLLFFLMDRLCILNNVHQSKLFRSDQTLLLDLWELLYCTSARFYKDADEGKELLLAAMNTLLVLAVARNPDGISSDQSECADTKPIVIWRAFYIQKITG